LIKGDNEAYDRLIYNGEQISNSNVTVNYNFFYSELDKLPQQELESLYNSLLKLMVVNISLYPINGDDPQLIFESLNSTGLALDESDKIRNYILMKLSAKEQEKVYKQFWSKIEEKTKNDTTKFIKYYLSVKTRDIPNDSRLYFAFKEYGEKNCDVHIDDFMKEILKYAIYFGQIKNGTKYKVINRLNYLEVNTVYPLLFDLFEAVEDTSLSQEEFEICLVLIEAYISRRIVCGLSTSSLNKIFAYLGAEIERYVNKYHISYFDSFSYALINKTQKSRFPNDNEFLEKFKSYELYSSKPQTRKYFLERLENYNNPETVDVVNLVESQELTIEHIMPQMLSKEWKLYLGQNYETIHTKYLHTVGNLTLSAYNSDYSNQSFDTKRDMPQKGFIYSKLYLNEYIKNQSVWNEEIIQKRAEIVATKALDIWKYPVTEFEPSEQEKWYSLEDDYDFTNKSIIKINILGDVINCSNLSDAYIKVFTLFFQLDEVKMKNEKNKYWGEDKSEFKTPHQISNDFFIETSLNAQERIIMLKMISALFGFEAEDIQFMVKEKIEIMAFDINDLTTYDDYKIGELARKIIPSLIKTGKVCDEEIELMFNKEYSVENFLAYYPVLAWSRDDNKVGDKRRYQKEPFVYKSKNYYLTVEWLESSRPKLINWTIKHL
jgi:hypothetical protein